MANQKGGKYVARGSYGCVYYPNLPCDTDGLDLPSDMNFVSKVTDHDSLEEEWKSIGEFNLNEIDPENKYFIYPTGACKLSTKSIKSESEFKRCDMYKKKNLSSIKSNYVNIIQPNGGIVSYKRKSALNFEKNWADYIRLLIGLGILHKNKIYHRDIKEDNIVYSSNHGFRYIDFGISAGYNSLPIPNNRELDERIEFHKRLMVEARSAIPILIRDVDRLTVQIRSNSSKSKMFRKSLTDIRKKIRKVKELRYLLDGMRAKEKFHKDNFVELLDTRYNSWSDTIKEYVYWPRDFFIIDKYINHKDDISIYNKDGSVNMAKYAEFSSSLIYKAEASYSNLNIQLNRDTYDKMIVSYQNFIHNIFINNKYSEDKDIVKLMNKATETLDIFSIGVFLASDYKVCHDRSTINRAYREDFKLFLNNLLSLNPETRPTIDTVITEFLIIIKKRIINIQSPGLLDDRFANLINELQEAEICSPKQIEAINLA